MNYFSSLSISNARISQTHNKIRRFGRDYEENLFFFIRRPNNVPYESHGHSKPYSLLITDSSTLYFVSLWLSNIGSTILHSGGHIRIKHKTAQLKVVCSYREHSALYMRSRQCSSHIHVFGREQFALPFVVGWAPHIRRKAIPLTSLSARMYYSITLTGS